MASWGPPCDRLLPRPPSGKNAVAADYEIIRLRFSSATSYRPWRRHRPSAWPVQYRWGDRSWGKAQ